MEPTSEGAAAEGASSCRVAVAVAAVVGIVGWVVGPCRVLAASSSSTSNSAIQKHREKR